MIEYRKGDLLDVKEGVIAHGVNCQGVMGSGVALAVKNKHPLVYDLYRDVCKELKIQGMPSLNLLGEVQLVSIDKLIVANCFTQDFYGVHQRQVDYEAVASCFRKLNAAYAVVNIPKIGAGLGGGNWEIISRIIEDEFKGTVICWELE